MPSDLPDFDSVVPLGALATLIADDVRPAPPPLTDDDLEALALPWEQQPGDYTADEPFRVVDEDSANWVARKVNEARARADHAKEWARREVAKAEQEEAWFLGRFGGELAAWARTAVKGKAKSVALPAGTVGMRKQPVRLEVTDEAAALAWARSTAPACLVTIPASERFSKSAAVAMLKTTGTVPDGCVAAGGEDAIYVGEPKAAKP